MTQAGSYRLAVAKRYWHAAHLILRHQTRPVEHMEPVLHLLGMSAELALKAYLTDKGVPDSSSKNIGHDLGACLRKAIELGLEVSSDEATCIHSMRHAHRFHFNRYGPKSKDGLLELGAYPLTDETMALEYVALLIDRIAGATDTLPLLKPVDLEELALIEAREQDRAEQITATRTRLTKQ